MEVIFQRVLVQHHFVGGVRMVGQFGGCHTLGGRPEAVGLEEVGAGQVVDEVDTGIVLRRVACHLIARGLAALRTGIAEAYQSGGLLHIGVLTRQAHQVQVAVQLRLTLSGQGIVTGRRGLQHVQRHHAETVGIVTKGYHTVMCHHNDGVEDDPRKDGHQYQFGEQPGVSIAEDP